jgi:hypothetical protein
VMPVDLRQLQEIHKLETEVDQARAGVKQRKQNRVDLIEALPEYQPIEEAGPLSRQPRPSSRSPSATLLVAVWWTMSFLVG